MRAIWKGAVSFGLVNVPIRLYSATENHDVQFRQVHREDGGRIKYQRVCNECGKQVAFDDIAKGYETEDGGMVVLDDSDFADLPSKTSKEIGVVKFVPADEIDPMWLDKSYYLEPAGQVGRQAVCPAARCAGIREADGDRHGVDPHPDDDGRAAGA